MERLDWKTLLTKLMLWQWVIVGVFIMTMAGIFLVYKDSLPPEIPIFYSKPWGVDQLGHPTLLLVPMILTTLIAALLILVLPKLKTEGELKVMVMTSGMLSEIILILAILRIVILVT